MMPQKFVTCTVWMAIGVLAMIAGTQIAAPHREDAPVRQQREVPVGKHPTAVPDLQEPARSAVDGHPTAAAKWEHVHELLSEQAKDVKGFRGNSGGDAKPAPHGLPTLAVEAPTAITPMTIGAMLSRDSAAPGEEISVLAGVRLLPGWHTYAVVPADEPYVPMKWILEPGTGITAGDSWIVPPPVGDSQDPRLEIYTSTPEPLMFMHRLRVADGASGEINVRVVLAYQACDFSRCTPLTKKIFDLKLTVTPAKK